MDGEFATRRFHGKVALLTGAAAGIGRATALRLAREGASLFLGDVTDVELAKTAEQVEALGAPVLAQCFDVSREDEVEHALASCMERFQRLDVLCNIAGILRFAHFQETSFETWRQVLSVNLDGTFLMCRAALPHLLETGGNVVNVGSTAGLSGLAYGAAYGASKGGVHALTRALAVEFTARGVRCNSVCPASIDTAMVRSPIPEDAKRRLLARSSSLHGPKGPESVADVIAFLASHEAAHISGEDIRIDGGALS